MAPRKFCAVADVWIVPRPIGSKYYKREWTKRLFTCMIKVDPNEYEERMGNDILDVRLEDRKTGELLAIAPYDGEHGITSVIDSARHYVLTLRAKKLEAYVGIEFRDSADSIDFSLAIQAFMRKRMFTDRQGWPSWSKRRTASLKHDRSVSPVKSQPKDNQPTWSAPVPEAISTNPSDSFVLSRPPSPRLSPSPPPQEVVNEPPQLSSTRSSQSSLSSLPTASPESSSRSLLLSSSENLPSFSSQPAESLNSLTHYEPTKVGSYYQMLSLKTATPVSGEDYLDPASSPNTQRLAPSDLCSFPKSHSKIISPPNAEFGEFQVASN